VRRNLYYERKIWFDGKGKFEVERRKGLKEQVRHINDFVKDLFKKPWERMEDFGNTLFTVAK
jgi:hypothetical protein